MRLSLVLVLLFIVSCGGSTPVPIPIGETSFMATIVEAGSGDPIGHIRVALYTDKQDTPERIDYTNDMGVVKLYAVPDTYRVCVVFDSGNIRQLEIVSIAKGQKVTRRYEL